ncbi:YqgE/AlgH family protein [Rhodophyticola sp. CCM32]|uniref:YqgE/AlgH family protein n=1 Tax=Rhodophyticola sp. CCM32 TaxID=2916397 RepID=UPI00107F2F22|nr:YqgE/AlgH family protein [Rhodophyticola sp. CCM32]QBY01714.1 YqgE/AlgH family protein [Rhodophyticola sp. CCM32]
MSPETVPSDLTGQLLIAMPGMGDPRFHGSVVFLCAHSEDGAMGLIVNKAITELTFAEILEQLDIPARSAPMLPICFGGPVETGRGFVLHSAEYAPRTRDAAEDGTLRVDTRFSMTATLDILRYLADGTGPEQALLTLGYAGWGPGQLEREIRDNGWLTCAASPTLVFGHRMQGKWEAALASLGVDPLMLSPVAGHA